MCCSDGKVQLPPFEPFPEHLYSLLMETHPELAHFMDRVHEYNGCFQMTSFGAKQVVEAGSMPTFQVQGQLYHLLGGLLPSAPKGPVPANLFCGTGRKESAFEVHQLR